MPHSSRSRSGPIGGAGFARPVTSLDRLRYVLGLIAAVATVPFVRSGRADDRLDTAMEREAAPLRVSRPHRSLTTSAYPVSWPVKKLGVPAVEFGKSFYSPHEVAAMASVHPSTILNYIAMGRLYAVKLSERTYRIPVRAVIGLLEPERLTPSSITVEPDADVEHEFAHEHEVETVGA